MHHHFDAMEAFKSQFGIISTFILNSKNPPHTGIIYVLSHAREVLEALQSKQLINIMYCNKYLTIGDFWCTSILTLFVQASVVKNFKLSPLKSAIASVQAVISVVAHTARLYCRMFFSTAIRNCTDVSPSRFQASEMSLAWCYVCADKKKFFYDSAPSCVKMFSNTEW